MVKLVHEVLLLTGLFQLLIMLSSSIKVDRLNLNDLVYTLIVARHILIALTKRTTAFFLFLFAAVYEDRNGIRTAIILEKVGKTFSHGLYAYYSWINEVLFLLRLIHTLNSSNHHLVHLHGLTVVPLDWKVVKA